ncbi:DMT family transporter [Mesotoga prima]|uniref:DMT family transporter n=1 Tax=Mesotoga prima TaxID=1184387 RepID=UPI002B82838D|nr:DMT family transporter [Mesotoga prima]HQN61640.1 DMT family transporter [Mesotoga prima]HUM22902.1 DMT family transporter [Mesotoga prima]
MNRSKEKSSGTKSVILLILTGLLWSTGGLLIKNVDSNPLAISGMRSMIASLVILVALGRPKFTWSLPQIASALSYSATVILFVSANKMTTAANAILLQSTAPIYVALLSVWILKERAKLLDWVTIIVVFGGMALFFFESLDSRGMTGNILAVASGVTFALFNIFMRLQKDGSPLESVLLGNILTAAIGVPFIVGSLPSPSGWISLFILGVAQLGLSYVFYSEAIKHSTALEAILILMIEPILSPVWVFLFLGEIPGKLPMIGGAVVIGAITIRFVLRNLTGRPIFLKYGVPRRSRRRNST